MIELIKKMIPADMPPRSRRTVEPTIAAAFLQELERLDRDGSTAARIETLLAPMPAGGKAGAGAVASAPGLGKQTLHRRLKAEGVPFEAVRAALRRKHAFNYPRHYPREQKTRYRLGFADPAFFRRAFRRWTGESPTAFHHPRCAA